MIKIDISQILDFVPKDRIEALEPECAAAITQLENGTGQGNVFLG